ncbi:MAG TPA: hypothetical protein VHS78_18565 [Candidatus Elarobacter sp.]|jgi:hypothetical protein|nr:hypothetical protein [Candidatus Elarobacter sp.]
MPCIDGMWDAYTRQVMHPGYSLIVRWCKHLEIEDVVRIDHASIVAAATDPKRFIGSWRIAFGDGKLPVTIVPFGVVNATHQYIALRERHTGTAAAPDSPVFAEVFGETVTRRSVCEAIRRSMVLLRLADTIKVDDEGHLV